MLITSVFCGNGHRCHRIPHYLEGEFEEFVEIAGLRESAEQVSS
jgi:hypothetical protein